MSKPQIVIIPGAWHTPFHMDMVKARLESAGYGVHIRQMPAVGNINPPQDLSEDVAAARSLIGRAIGDGREVVVIVHSWGGIVACTGLNGLGKLEREAEDKKGGITRVGYLAAFLVPERVSMMDAIGGKMPASFEFQGPYVYIRDAKALYSELSASEQQFFFARLESHSLATFNTKTTAASWRRIPTSYLVCEDDQSIPASAQEAMIRMVQDAGGAIEVQRIKAGHSPFLSQPDEIVKWIEIVARG